MVVSAAVRLGWSGLPRRSAMEKGDPSVHHHLFRHTTRQPDVAVPSADDGEHSRLRR
jgi:hypothetical protein